MALALCRGSRLTAACVFLLTAPVAASKAKAGMSPVAKIVEMLGGMKAKVLKDMDNEKKGFEEFMNFCDDESKDKDFALKSADRGILDLSAVIDDAAATVTGLTDDISEIGVTIAGKVKEHMDASKLRESQHEEYRAAEADLLKALDEISRAAQEVKKKGGSFLQADDDAGSSRMSQVADALSQVVNAEALVGLQRHIQATKRRKRHAEEGELSLASLEAEDSEEHGGGGGSDDGDSGNVVEVLDSTKDKAEKQLDDLRKAEMEAQNGFALAQQGIQNFIKNLKESLAEATNRKAAAEQASSTASGEKEETEKTKAADADYLRTLRLDCQEKATEWEVRMRDAKGEITAIEKAVEILEGGVKVSLVQTGARTRRTMMRMTTGARKVFKLHDPFADDDDDDSSGGGDAGGSDDDGDNLASANARLKIVAHLSDLGSTYHNHLLMQIANHAKVDPMAKIKGLVEEMIAKLLKEQQEEATQKAFCDAEIGKSKKSLEDKTAKLDKLSARLDKASTSKAALEQEARDLTKEIAEIDKATAEATQIRSAEHAEYEQATKDYSSSQDACARAVEVLKSYYDGTSLVQTNTSSFVQEGADTGSGEDSQATPGNSDTGSAIIEFLMVAEEDFAKLLAEEETNEAKAKDAFNQLAQQNKISKATKAMEIKGKESEIKSLSVTINDHTEDRSSMSREIDALNSYLDKLKPQCETKTMSPEEKAAARKAEIEGLKDALDILSGDGI